MCHKRIQIKSNSLFCMAAISWIKTCNNTTSIKLELEALDDDG